MSDLLSVRLAHLPADALLLRHVCKAAVCAPPATRVITVTCPCALPPARLSAAAMAAVSPLTRASAVTDTLAPCVKRRTVGGHRRATHARVPLAVAGVTHRRSACLETRWQQEWECVLTGFTTRVSPLPRQHAVDGYECRLPLHALADWIV